MAVFTSLTEGDGRLCFHQCLYVGRYIFVNNFLASVQVRLSPNFVIHTHGHRGRGDQILEGHCRWGMVCTLLNALLV